MFVDADVSGVEAVVAATDAVAATDVDVIEALASLVEKSLVREVDPPRGEPRLRMLGQFASTPPSGSMRVHSGRQSGARTRPISRTLPAGCAGTWSAPSAITR